MVGEELHACSQLRVFCLCRRITEVDKAILDLKVQRRKLEVRFQNLCELIDKERKVAKELVVMGKRDRALLTLKRAKLQDSSKESCEKWIYKVDEMVSRALLPSVILSTE